MPLNRRGLSLAELLAALTLTGWLGTLTARLLTGAAFVLRDRSERIGSEQNLRLAAAAVRATLQPLGQDTLSGADLLSIANTGFSARTIRGSGTLCAATTGALTARVQSGWWSGERDPVPGRDSLLVGRVDTAGWRALALVSPPHAALCPDGSDAWSLDVSADSALLTGVGAGSPVQVFEGIEVRMYASGPDLWTGLRLLATTQAIQPFAGPMTGTGLSLSYERRDGSPAGAGDEVTGVGFRISTLTERAGGVGVIRGPTQRADSLSGFIALLNHP